MALKLITAASLPAVSLEDMKVHLKVEADQVEDDDLIETMIKAAVERAEQITGRALMPQTWELTMSCFSPVLPLTRVPVVSITSLKYIDPAGVLQTLGNTLYQLDNFDDFSSASVVPAYGLIWPDVRICPGAVALRYLAGYADADAVPDSIKSWIKLQVHTMYVNREAEGAVQTYALGNVDRLLDRYKVWGL